jgi:acyl-CoA thioester hydrolase
VGTSWWVRDKLKLVPRIFHTSRVVGLESIDAVGHVNNREYLRWMEEVAVEHSTAQGWPMERYYADRMAWVAATHFIEYLRPSLLDDPLDVYTWISRWSERDCLRRYAIVRERKLLARGETVWTFVDMDSARARSIPPAVLEAFTVVPDDDAELKELNLARRERRAAAA